MATDRGKWGSGVGWGGGGGQSYAGYLDRGLNVWGEGGNGNSFIKVHFRPSVDEPVTLRGRHRLRLETCGRRAGAAVLSASL